MLLKLLFSQAKNISMDRIHKYFPNITQLQTEQLSQLGSQYEFWNQQINVISRKDIHLLYERHVLHSLAIAKLIDFKPGTKVLDVGTGGGLPGIPLAILYPETQFTLIDSIGKKIKVVNAISDEIGLKNVHGIQTRVQELDGQFDFIVSRAVTNLPDFLNWIKGKVHQKSINSLINGLLYLKGGDLEDELNQIKKHSQIYPLSDWFDEEFFETKKLVYVY
jgi:16S rRNA (guanine527-N7)-methyltransferase